MKTAIKLNDVLDYLNACIRDGRLADDEICGRMLVFNDIFGPYESGPMAGFGPFVAQAGKTGELQRVRMLANTREEYETASTDLARQPAPPDPENQNVGEDQE